MKLFFVSIVSFFTSSVFSQISYDKEIYLDSLFIETNFENAFYSRIVKNYGAIQNEYLFTDYYKSGQVLMVGKSKNRDYLAKKGQFIYYFENRKKKQIINYDESIPFGSYYSWYESGEKKEVGEYLMYNKENKEAGLLKIDQFWDENCHQKVINGNGYYRDEIEKAVSNGKLKEGLKDSIWAGIDETVHISFTEEYNEGKLVFGTSIDSLGIAYHYKEAIIKPKPKNGIENFYRYIARNFKMPNDITDVKGKIFLSFVIEKDGTIGDVKVIKGVHPKLDSEAVRILYSAAPWQPGISRGLNCRVKYSLPITISGP